MVGDNIFGGQYIKEVVVKILKASFTCTLKFQRLPAGILARMARRKKLKSLRHEGKMVYYERGE